MSALKSLSPIFGERQPSDSNCRSESVGFSRLPICHQLKLVVSEDHRTRFEPASAGLVKREHSRLSEDMASRLKTGCL